MSDTLAVDGDALREAVKRAYRKVALVPDGAYHFHTGRPLAERLGYDVSVTANLPDAAIESFAGVGNPFSQRRLQAGERVVDLGSGGGLDCFVAAEQVGAEGSVTGIDMTEEMLEKSRRTADELGLPNVSFKEGVLEALPLGDASADVVISNGVFNLCVDKRQAFGEAMRVLRPGGYLQFADIANGQPVPEAAIRDIDLWTA